MSERGIAFLDWETLARDVRLHPPGVPHRWATHPHTTPEQAAKRLKGDEIAVVNMVRLDRRYPEQLPELCLVGIVTPHVAWASRGAQRPLSDQFIDLIEAFVEGAPRHVVRGEF